MAAGKLGAALAGASPAGLALGGLALVQGALGLRDRRRKKKELEAFKGSEEVQDILQQGRQSKKDIKTGNLGYSLAQKRQKRMEERQARRGQRAANRAEAKRLRGSTPFGSGAAGKALDRIRRQEAETDVAIASQIDRDARQKAIADRQFAQANIDRALQMKQNLAAQESAIPGLAQTIVDPVADATVAMAQTGLFDERAATKESLLDQDAIDRALRTQGKDLGTTGSVKVPALNYGDFSKTPKVV